MGYGNGKMRIARVGLHRFEEPCISTGAGSGTIFFTGCALRCLFCQNYAISRGGRGLNVDGGQLTALASVLAGKGAANINLVSPSIWIDRLIPVLGDIKERTGLPVVWNGAGCEAVEDLKKLEGLVDVWLPDFKYGDDALGALYSGVEGYSGRALDALKEMRRQRPRDVFDPDGRMLEGVVVRHLVLPGAADNAARAMRLIASVDERLYVSVMGQYFPTPAVADHPLLSRRLTEEEYSAAVEAFFAAGLINGYCQELSSASEEYVPDFDLDELAELLKNP